MKTTNNINESSSVSNQTIKKELKEYLLEYNVNTQEQIIERFCEYNLNQSKVSRLLKDIAFEKNYDGIYSETRESTLGRNKKIFATICSNEHITINSPLVYALAPAILSNLDSIDEGADDSDSMDEPSTSPGKKTSDRRMFCIPIQATAGSESYLANVIANVIEDIKYFGITTGFRCIFILTYSEKRAKKIHTRLLNAKNAK